MKLVPEHVFWCPTKTSTIQIPGMQMVTLIAKGIFSQM